MVRVRFAALVVAALASGVPARSQVWEVRNHLLTLPGGSQDDASFGSAMVVGDFDGDGDDDLVVRSHPGEGPSRIDLFLGSPSGLAAPAGGSGVVTSTLGGFGAALAAGDFDTDAADELAVGAPSAGVLVDLVPVFSAGVVRIFDWTGSAWSPAATFSQATPGVPGGAEQGDAFGSALAAGDFDDDGFDDLAIGVPREDAGANLNGAVNVLYGAADGLAAAGAQVWFRGDGGISGTADNESGLGSSLATGDFDSDDVADLAIGAPGPFEKSTSNFVVVLFGIDGVGLTAADQQTLDSADFGAQDYNFGSALAAGDLDRSSLCEFFGSCADDLVVGVPLSEVETDFGEGRVLVFAGSESTDGIDPAVSYEIHQGSFDPEDTTAPEHLDRFGTRLAVGPLVAGAGDDVVVGTPFETFDPDQEAGCVHSISGGTLDLATSSYQFFFARSALAAAPVADENHFGDALAIGDFDVDGWGDLAIGVPGRFMDGHNDAGAVQILYGALFADGFGIGDESAWMTP